MQIDIPFSEGWYPRAGLFPLSLPPAFPFPSAGGPAGRAPGPRARPHLHQQACLDLCHVPLKSGAETLKVIEKQIARLGLTRYDLVGGTGDGGGENEGAAGIHAILESSCEAYVRRRCFGHLPWRVAGAGLDFMAHRADTEAIPTYLHDGTTWSRLQGIAAQSPARGGIGPWPTREIESFFQTAPPNIIEERFL